MGHPYSPEDINNAEAALQGLTEMDALIRYLQMLGTSFDASQADAPMEGM